MKPVVSGYRLALVYNLLRQGSPPQPPVYDEQRDGLTAQLAAEDEPLKLVYPWSTPTPRPRWPSMP